MERYVLYIYEQLLTSNECAAVQPSNMNVKKRKSIIMLMLQYTCALICICGHRCWALTLTIHVICWETWDETCKWDSLSLWQGTLTFISQSRSYSCFILIRKWFIIKSFFKRKKRKCEWLWLKNGADGKKKKKISDLDSGEDETYNHG